ncbi:hypothetical protein BH11PLA1_BH11PLA1_11430 [soil metagenome]
MRCVMLAAFAGSCVALTSPTLFAGDAQIVYPIAAHSLSNPARANVPGMAGLQFTNFGRMHRSDGTAWVTVPVVSGAASAAQDQLVLVGHGTLGLVSAQEGVSTVDGSGTLLNLSSGAVPRINDASQWALAFTPASSTFARVVKSTAGGIATTANSFDAAPALGANAMYGPGFASHGITRTGAVSFQNDLIIDPDFSIGTRANLADNGATVVARVNQTVPLNQLGGSTLPLTALEFANTGSGTYHTSADGSKRLSLGDLGAATPGTQRVLLVNTAVVLQAGQVVAGFTITTIDECWMESNGDWFAKGTVTPVGGGATVQAIYRNGVQIARIGAPIFPGATENWTTFVDYKGDNYRRWAIVGVSSAPTLTNSVIVMSSKFVVARANDPVALELDGLFNDSLYLQGFRDRCFMGNDAFFYVGARLKNNNTATSSLGANVSMVRIALPGVPCSAADIADDAGNPLPTLSPNNGVNEGDYNAFFNNFFTDQSIGSPADIADDSGSPLPPFGPAGGTNNGVNEGDYNAFFNTFFSGCAG